jgi:hypothetical protein
MQAGACCRRRTTSIRPIRSSAIWASSAHSQRGRALLRRRAGRQRLLERDVLLRLLRGAAPHALDEIGGIAVETVTEDAHTSLRMQMNGWNTAYINIPQAAGLATERLSGHVKQRIRWARGMVQILRIDNPLFAPGLKPAQRLCYFNAMTHFLYALPRLIFLTAPLIYLILGHTNVPGYWAAILAYAFPHLVLSNVTNSRIQGSIGTRSGTRSTRRCWRRTSCCPRWRRC